MIGRDHVIFTGAMCSSSILMLNFPPFNHGLGLGLSTSAAMVGALMPDIDHQNSLMSKMIHIPLYRLFKHRGVTHSLIGFGVFSLIVIFGLNATGTLLHITWATTALAYGLMFGYFFHLLEDSWSQSGIRWLAPFSPYDNYVYQKHQTILRQPVRYRKVRKYHRIVKVPIRHWWGRGYVVDKHGLGERWLVRLSLGLLLFSVIWFLVHVW